MDKKNRVRIPNLSKIRAELQKEIGSACPFCKNDEVGHFEIHHVDKNPSNNDSANLLLLCPTCHSKITKGDIPQQNVVNIKQAINNTIASIQFISVSIDSENCGWIAIENAPNAFEAVKLKSFFPVFYFSFINHSNRTVLLTNIEVTTKRLPIGLCGPIFPLPKILRSIIKYKIEMPAHGQTSNIVLSDEIEVPHGRAFKFQVELFTDSMDDFHPQFNRYVLQFSFGFNNDFYIDIPKVLLNTKTDYDKLSYTLLV